MAEDPHTHTPNGLSQSHGFAAIKPNTFIMSGSTIKNEQFNSTAGLLLQENNNPGEIKFEPHSAFRHSKYQYESNSM